jgi:hypothetical protein
MVQENASVEQTYLLRAIRAESELDAYKYRQHNEIFHRDSVIGYLKLRMAEVEEALEAANARIRELEGVLSKEDTNDDQSA